MTLVGRHNIAMMKSTTTGTGTLTLTTAVRGFLTFALAGVVNSERVTYTIRDGANTEVGIGTYTSSGTTLSRDTVLSSTNGGSKITCTGKETVAITVAAEDISPFAAFYYSGTDTFTNGSSNNTLSLDSETIDQFDLASVSSNRVTIARKGYYLIYGVLYVSAASAFNGKLSITMGGYGNWNFGYTTAMNILDSNYVVGPTLWNTSSDNQQLSAWTMDNSLGSSIDTYFVELTVCKIGNK